MKIIDAIKKYFKAIGIAFCAVFLMGLSNGSQGANSTGTSEVFLAIGDVIRIWGMQDFDFGNWVSGNLNRSRNIRVNVNYGTNDATRTYQVTGVGDHVSGNFLLENIAGDTLAYQVWFNDQTGGVGRVPLTAGVTLTGQSGAEFPLTRAARSANIRIRILETNLALAPDGEYTGHLVVTVQPE